MAGIKTTELFAKATKTAVPWAKASQYIRWFTDGERRYAQQLWQMVSVRLKSTEVSREYGHRKVWRHGLEVAIKIKIILGLVHMNLQSIWLAFMAALFAMAISLSPAPAFAALAPITEKSLSATTTLCDTVGYLDLLATQDKDLPGFTNTSTQAVTLKIQSEGDLALIAPNIGTNDQDVKYKARVDGEGYSFNEGFSWKYPEWKPGALIAEIKDAKGLRKSVIGGKNQTFELQPNETVTFIVNDDPNFYGNNVGALKIKYTINPNCKQANPDPDPKPNPNPDPTPAPCNVDGLNASAKFFLNTAYKSFDDSPFKSLKTNADWFEFETFDGPTFQTNTTGVVASRLNETSKYTDSSFYDSVDSDDGAIDGKGRGQDRLVLSIGYIKFTFDDKRGFPTDAGIVFTDVHASNPSFGESTLTFEAFDASGKSLGIQGPFKVGGDYSTMGESGDDRFFGVHYNGGISSFRVIVPAVMVGVEFDHLQYGRKCS
jgi:hypothetical protein